MNDEIKEILDKLNNINNYDYTETCDNKNSVIEKEYDIYLSKKETDNLLDYITNLQQENEKLKEQVKREVEVRDYEVSLKINYKSRIEKATNKVQYIIDIGFDYDGYNDVDNLKILVDELVDLARQTKNILNGDNNE